MFTAYIIVLVLALIALIIAVEVLRRKQQDEATAKIRNDVNGRLFTCLAGNRLQPEGIDWIAGGVLGGPLMAAIRSGTFRPARAYFREELFVLEARDPVLVRVYNEELKFPSAQIVSAACQPLTKGKRLADAVKAAAITAVSFAVIVFAIVVYQIGVEVPGKVGVAFGVSCAGGVIAAVLFVLLPQVIRNFRSASVLSLFDGDGKCVCMLFLRPDHKENARRVLQLEGKRWSEHSTIEAP